MCIRAGTPLGSSGSVAGAAHEAMVDEAHFWDEVHQAIVDMSTDAHDKDIMEQCEYDEQAASS